MSGERRIAIKIKKYFAIGDKAYEMYEKAPDDIRSCLSDEKRCDRPF